MTHLCVSIFVESIEQAKRDIATAVEAGADMVELRLDLMTDQLDAKTFLGGMSVPTILTCRPTSEGGLSDASAEDRMALLGKASSLYNGLVDIELASLQDGSTFDELGKRTIVSVHDFVHLMRRGFVSQPTSA